MQRYYSHCMNSLSPMKPPSSERSYAGLPAEELRAHAEAVAGQLDAVREQLTTLNARAQGLVAEQRAIADEQARLKLAQDGPRDWAWLLADDPQSSEVRYKAAQKLVRELAEHEGHAGLSADSTNVHTGQRVLRVALLKGVPQLTRQVERSLVELLPFIEPCTPERRGTEKVKYLSVFEASLSEFGTYYLAVDESRGLFELRKTRYSSSTVFQAASLGALLDYVEQHCYYDDRTDRQDD